MINYKNFLNEIVQTEFKLKRIMDLYRDRVLDTLNDKDNDFFWNLVEFVNWSEFINNKDKIDFDDLREKVETEFGDINEYHRVYELLKRNLTEYFEPVVLNDETESQTGDDGYIDLISSIIGKGKDFIGEILKDDDILINMVKNKGYRENFGYIFNK